MLYHRLVVGLADLVSLKQMKKVRFVVIILLFHTVNSTA